jgi:hypothetical protein
MTQLNSNKKKPDKEPIQRPLHDRWADDGLPNVVEPTEESLAHVVWFNEQEDKKKKAKKGTQ